MFKGSPPVVKALITLFIIGALIIICGVVIMFLETPVNNGTR